jgi:hypothetical protein
MSNMDPPGRQYTRERMIAFLTAWMRQEPTLTLSAARDEGRVRGFNVSRREYEEARKLATGSALHPAHAPDSALEASAHAEPFSDFDALQAAEEPAPRYERPASRAALEGDGEDEGGDDGDDRSTETREDASESPPPPREKPVRKVASTGAAGASKTAETRDFLATYLRENPTTSYLEAKAAAGAAGVRLPSPIDYGLARKAAGVAASAEKQKGAPSAEDGSAPKTIARVPTKKAKVEAAPKPKPASRTEAPKRPPAPSTTSAAPEPKAARGTSARTDPFVEARRVLSERERYLTALRAIARAIDGALDGPRRK